MFAKLQNHAKWLLPALLIVLLLSSVWIYRDRRENELNRYYSDEILVMSPDTTAEDLEEDGYLNLTGIQDEQIPEIVTFLHGDSFFRPVILKTFTESEDGPVIRYFHRPDGSQTVYMTTYFVVDQRSLNMNCPFSTALTETVNADGLTEVWLVQTENMSVHAPSYPVIDPVLFYTYKAP